jgi:hypothetical protein
MYPNATGDETSRDPEPRHRSRERDLDLYVAHELATGSPAAAVLWQAVGYPPPAVPVSVRRQAPRGIRSTDVLAEGDGHVLLCENKAASGSFEDLQPESYAEYCTAHPAARAVLVAPRDWLRQSHDVHFHACVAVEDLADALMQAAEVLGGDGAGHELRLSYLYRAEELRRYATDPGYQGDPDDRVRDFGDLYRRLLAAETGGRLSLSTSKTLRNRTAGFATMRGPALGRDASGREITVNHKLDWGAVDLALDGGSLAEFRSRIAQAGQEKAPPDGWTVQPQPTGKRPVLHHDAEKLDPRTASADDAAPVIVGVIRWVLELGTWLTTVGIDVLYG